MRRMMVSLMAAAMLFLASGCISVSAKKTWVGTDSEVIALDGRAYIVNKATGKVSYIDLETAVPFEAEVSEEPTESD